MKRLQNLSSQQQFLSDVLFKALKCFHTTCRTQQLTRSSMATHLEAQTFRMFKKLLSAPLICRDTMHRSHIRNSKVEHSRQRILLIQHNTPLRQQHMNTAAARATPQPQHATHSSKIRVSKGVATRVLGGCLQPQTLLLVPNKYQTQTLVRLVGGQANCKQMLEQRRSCWSSWEVILETRLCLQIALASHTIAM